MKDGFKIDEMFRSYSIDDLSTIQLRVALKGRKDKN